MKLPLVIALVASLSLASPALAQSSSPSIVTAAGAIASAYPGFGARVALDGTTAIVGCRVNGSGSGSSRAVLYERGASGWTLVGDFTGLGRYSTSVDISGNRAVVGAPYISGEKMYVYERVGGVWTQFQVLDGYVDGHDWFGYSVAIDGDWAACTAPESLSYAGPIHLYRRGATAWTSAGVFEDPDDYWSGEALDLSVPRVVTGDPDADGDVGRAVVFLLPTYGGQGDAEATLRPADLASGDRFGTALALSGDRLAVGAPGQDVATAANAGAVYLYERNAGAWTIVAKLRATPPLVGEQLGSAVALDGERIVLGGQGVAYLFERLAGVWTQSARLVAPVASVRFGSALALDGSQLLAGARDLAQVFPYELTDGPFRYCTAKLNSLGCTPAIQFSGTPSSGSTASFWIGATQVLEQKSGTLYYGTNGAAAQPFQGGTMCVAAPRRRTGVQVSSTVGVPDDCSGTYAFDFGARVSAGLDPALVPGVTVQAQYWTRDGLASFQTGFTDALEFVLAP